MMHDPTLFFYRAEQMFKYLNDTSIEWQQESKAWNRESRVPFSFSREFNKECPINECS